MRFKGVSQVVLFNWPLYVIALSSALLALTAKPLLPEALQPYLLIAVGLGMASMLLSLIASWYVYDLTNLYKFDYLPKPPSDTNHRIANIHAGFDETSTDLASRFPEATLDIYDFYDPEKHTEASIRRARLRFPASAQTVSITTSKIPVGEDTYDQLFLVFAAHEIRGNYERLKFFRELKRIAKPTARLHVIEHLRNLPNALVYSIGCLHFHSEQTWQTTFKESGWCVAHTARPNAFITAYTLQCSSI